MKEHIKAFILGYENQPKIELIKCSWTPKQLVRNSKTGKMSASKFSKQYSKLPFKHIYEDKKFLFDGRDYAVGWTWKHTGMPTL
jgi:hypothetical protein